MYSKQAKEVLEKYGWYEGRKIDISEQLEMLEKAGFEIFDKVKEFIVEFDGLRLPAEYRNKNFDEKNPNNWHNFDVLHYIRGIFSLPAEKWGGYKESITTHIKCTEKVFPIGGLDGWYMTLYITESGKIIDDLTIYGNSIEEGIENLATHKHVGFIPDKPVDPVRKALWREFVAEREQRYINILTYGKTGKVSWKFESEVYSVDVTNCVRECTYSKKYILLTFKEDAVKKRVLFDAKANFVLAYTLDENKIFTSEKDYYIVDDLHFVAYDRWQNKVVVLADNNKLYVYDLKGKLISEVVCPRNLSVASAKIDEVGYIRIKCKPINSVNDEDVLTYIIDYNSYELVKDPLFT